MQLKCDFISRKWYNLSFGFLLGDEVPPQVAGPGSNFKIKGAFTQLKSRVGFFMTAWQP
jgi:hypothetical protein